MEFSFINRRNVKILLQFSINKICAFISAFIFFIVTNFGAWVTGMYDYNLEIDHELCNGHTFFGYSVISTLILSVFIETIYKFSISKIKNISLI